MDIAVIKTGGKQYVVKEEDELYVDKLSNKIGETVSLQCLLKANTETNNVKVGKPFLEDKILCEVLEHVKGEKLNILRFKSKVRYRKRKGFRPFFTKIKIISVNNSKVGNKKEKSEEVKKVTKVTKSTKRKDMGEKGKKIETKKESKK